MIFKIEPFNQILLIYLCIAMTLLNISHPAFAAEALEINRPRAAEGNLSVSVAEDLEGSDMERASYILTFKNESDQEVSFTDLTFKFPELAEQPLLLTAEEADTYQQSKEVQATPVQTSPHTVNHGSYSYPYYPHYHHSYASGGHHSDAKAWGVLIVVIAVVVVIALIANGVSKSKKSNAKSESVSDSFVNQDPKGPLNLLRYQETKRKIILRRNKSESISTMLIEVTDKNEEKRTFRANMNGKAAM